jgi:hypothetical protein
MSESAVVKQNALPVLAKVASNYLFCVCLTSLLVFSAQADEEEMIVGRNVAGKLKVDVTFAQPLGLPVSIFPGITGYATGEVGLHSAASDDPTNDFFQLSSAVDLRLILLSKDPGMEVWNDHGSAYMEPGEAFFIGAPAFDTHPVWDLVGGTPGMSYSMTLKVIDLNGVYTESEPFVVSFTPNPPILTITPAAPGFVTLSWTPATAGLVLQVAPALEASTWTNAPSNGTTPITLPTSSGAQFFRVSR